MASQTKAEWSGSGYTSRGTHFTDGATEEKVTCLNWVPASALNPACAASRPLSSQ